MDGTGISPAKELVVNYGITLSIDSARIVQTPA